MEFVSDITNAIVGGVSNLGTGLATAVVDTWNTVMLTETGGLSNFASWGLCFLGVGLVIGFVRKFCHKN